MSNNEQKFGSVWMICILIIMALFVIISCGKKPMPSNEAKEIDKSSNVVNVKETTNTQTDRSKAIIDSLIIAIGQVKTSKPECDSICQEAVDHVLEQMNRAVISGNNRYNLLYDKYTKLFTVSSYVAESLIKKSDKSRDSLSSKTRIITRITTITKPVEFVPWYWEYPAYLGWAAAALIIFKIIVKTKSWLKPSII